MILLNNYWQEVVILLLKNQMIGPKIKRLEPNYYLKIIRFYIKHISITLEFRNIYEKTSRELTKEKILKWIEKTKLLKMTVFNTAANSLKYHLETI